MKTRIFSLAIALIALLSFENIYAQGGGKPHFVGQVCFNEATGEITGKIAGVGSDLSDISVIISGEYGCRNNGGKMPNPWSQFSISGTISDQPDSNGHYTFTASVNPLQIECHENNWTAVFRRLVATVTRGNKSSTSNITIGCN